MDSCRSIHKREPMSTPTYDLSEISVETPYARLLVVCCLHVLKTQNQWSDHSRRTIAAPTSAVQLLGVRILTTKPSNELVKSTQVFIAGSLSVQSTVSVHGTFFFTLALLRTRHRPTAAHQHQSYLFSERPGWDLSVQAALSITFSSLGCMIGSRNLITPSTTQSYCAPAIVAVSIDYTHPFKQLIRDP